MALNLGLRVPQLDGLPHDVAMKEIERYLRGLNLEIEKRLSEATQFKEVREWDFPNTQTGGQVTGNATWHDLLRQNHHSHEAQVLHEVTIVNDDTVPQTFNIEKVALFGWLFYTVTLAAGAAVTMNEKQAAYSDGCLLRINKTAATTTTDPTWIATGWRGRVDESKVLINGASASGGIIDLPSLTTIIESPAAGTRIVIEGFHIWNADSVNHTFFPRVDRGGPGGVDQWLPRKTINAGLPGYWPEKFVLEPGDILECGKLAATTTTNPVVIPSYYIERLGR